MRIEFTTHYGTTRSFRTSPELAQARLEYLDEQERVTKECAPTDSGGTRADYLAEASALREALASRALRVKMKAWRAWLKRHGTTELVWPFLAWEVSQELGGKGAQ